MRFLLLLFLCLSHLALSVEYSTPLLTINGISYKNATISYDEKSTTAKIFHDDGVSSVHISQIPHDILPNLKLSPQIVSSLIEKKKKIASDIREKKESRKEIVRNTLKNILAEMKTYTNSKSICFSPAKLDETLDNCYIGFLYDAKTKKRISNKYYAVMMKDATSFSSKKLYRIRVSPTPPIKKNIPSFLFLCYEKEFEFQLKVLLEQAKLAESHLKELE